jgi:CubicO group peptidase (beta-lactamase class C family)
MTSGLYGGEKYESEVFYTLEESADSIAKYTPVAFKPGTAWAYDGKGMQAAGRFAEVATGKTWRELARALILKPCGMDSTDYDYYKSNPWIAGGIKTTPADYMRFLRMIISNGLSNGKRVLSEPSIDMMFSAPNQNKPLYPQADPVWPIDHPAYQYGMDTVRYGFSSWVFAYNPSTNIVEQICSPGFWGVAPWADRTRKITGVIFMDGGLLGPLAYNTEISLIDLIDKSVGNSAILKKNRREKNILFSDLVPELSVYSINGKYLGKFSGVQMNQNSSQLLILKNQNNFFSIATKMVH